MALTKNYGIAGLAEGVQYGKNGGWLFYDAVDNSFSVKQVATEDYADFFGQSLTAVTGDVTVQSETGKIQIQATSISLEQAGVMKFDGSGSVIIPVGTQAQRPETPATGMIRINTSYIAGPTPEFYNGSGWTPIGQGLTIEGTDPISVSVVGNTATITLNVVPVTKGGTGLDNLVAGQILYGNGTDPVGQSSDLLYEDVEKRLTIGGEHPIQLNGNTGTITTTAVDGDLVLLPNGDGAVVVASSGASVIQTNPGETLTVRAKSADLVLESETGSTTMRVNASSKISVDGPTAEQYITGLAPNDLATKHYVDTRISAINGGNY